MEQIAKLADLTLKGVASHTEFLTKLWTLTTFVGGAIAVVLAIFGIRSIRDVQRLKEQAHTDIAEIKKNFEQMSKDTTANHVVMMACYSAKLLVDSAIAIELRYKSGKDDIKAADKSEMEREANDLFKSAKDQLREVLQLNEPKDPAVGAWVYNLYAYALSEIGEFSQALTAAKKSLGFRPANASALYNAACYAALLHLAKESIDYLKQAVEHDHTFLNAAKTDPDFTAIRNSKEFKEFVGE